MSGTTPDKYFIIGDSTSLGASKRFYINGTTGHVGINEISQANDALRVNGHLNTNSLSVTSGNTILEENLTVKEHTILKKNLTVIGDASFNAITLTKSDDTTDINAKLGNGIFGFSGTSDNMGIQHESLVVNGNNYAVKQNSSGETSINAASNQRILFCNSNKTKMTIKNTGEVGIGTEDPSGDLHIYGNTDSHGSAIIEGIGENYSAFLDLKNTEYSKENSETGGHYRLKSYGGETENSIIRNGDFAIQQMPYDSITALERFTISNAGNVGIGTSAPGSSTTATIQHSGSGNGEWSNGGALQLVGGTPETTDTQGLLIGVNTANEYTFLQSAKHDDDYNDIVLNPKGGNVGIGTDAPSAKMDVNGTALISNVSISDDSTSGMIGHRSLNNSSGSYALLMNSDGTTYLNGNGTGNPPLRFRIDGNDKMFLDKNGNFGIGKSIPSYKLDVNGVIRGDSNIRMGGSDFYNSGTYLNFEQESTNGEFRFRLKKDNSSIVDVFNINNNGNVGIGTTAPDEKLCVNGTVKLVKGLTIERNSSTFDDSTIDNRQWCIDMDTLDDDDIGVLDDLRFRYRSSYAHATTDDKVWAEKTAMTLRAGDGALGIGTDLPAAKLDVYGDFMVHSPASGIKFIPSAYNNSSNANIEFIANDPIDASDYISEINSHTDTTSTASTTDHSHLQITGGNSKEKSIIITTGNDVRNIQGWNSSQLAVAADAISGTEAVPGTSTGNTSENISLQAMGGNVGIGTTSPLYKLHIDCGSALSTNGVFIRNQLVNNNQVTFLRLGIGSENYAQISAHTLAGDKTYLQFHTQSGDGTVSGNISERMRIDENGNVGIGTTSPNYTLDVDGSLNCTELRIGGSSLTNTSNRINASGIAGGGVTDAQFDFLSGVSEDIQSQLDDRALKTDIPTGSYQTYSSTSGTNGSLRAGGRIFNIGHGNVNPNSRSDNQTVGCCTFLYGLSNISGFQGLWFSMRVRKRGDSNNYPQDGMPDYASSYHKNLNLKHPHHGGVHYPDTRFHGVVASTQDINWSDNRLKHNEETIVNGLEIIRLLNPLKYDKTFDAYDEDYNGEVPEDTPREAGLIAQEILKIPDLEPYVSEGDETYKHGGTEMISIYGLNYNSIFTYNIAATKELDTIVQNQQEIIETQNTKIANLETELAAIKAHLGI